MEIIVLVGYAAAVIIGVSLGLIGGGGSILTVPVLVYILGIDPVLATAYSLFVVGSTSLVGSFTYMKKQLVDYKTALVFAIPSFIAVFLTRKFIVPALPDPLLVLGELEITKSIG
ncbi:MAG: TSUP family transporter, partial [Algoriphagus sp.]